MNSKKTSLIGLALLLLILCILFAESFRSGVVHFSNDGPLGAVSARQLALPEGLKGVWQETNWVGGWAANFAPSPSVGLLWLLGPVGYAKFYQIFACLFLGVSAWFCFRRLKLNPTVAVIGGLAAALNGDFLSYACWGLGSLTIAVAFFFLAIAAVGDGTGKHLIVRLILAGFAIGMSVMEGFDNGAIFSLFLAAYVVWTFFANTDKAQIGLRLAKGVGSVAVVAVAAGLMASAVMFALITTQVKGVAMFDEQAQTPTEKRQAELAQWQFATQFSLPKKESFRLLVPGLFGYRMDSPEGKQYWGMMGSAHVWDDYLEQSNRDPNAQPGGAARFSGAGFYAGFAVLLVGLWAVIRSFSSKSNAFAASERRLVWFWALMAIVSLGLAWGRFAPFYQIFYELPYFSTIRNPYKFVHPLSFSLVFLFGFGLQGIWRAYLEPRIQDRKGAQFDFKGWWKDASKFDRRWTIGTAAFLIIATWAGLIYMGSRESMVKYLETVGFRLVPNIAPELQAAHLIFAASRVEMLWGVLFIVLTILVLWFVVAGFFGGSKTKWGLIALGAVLVIDLMRANLPWVVHYSYPERYASTELYEALSENAHEHRVSTSLPMIQSQISWGAPRLQDQQTAQGFIQTAQNLLQVYGVEWKQHQYPYFNIQTLDIVQEPRVSSENKAYREAFPMNDPRAQLRMLKLTNTRYLLGFGDPFLPPLNELAGSTNAFRSILFFGMEQAGEFVKPVESTNSPTALIEYTEALPRAKLYSNWEVIEDDNQALRRLADPSFDPDASLIIDTAIEPSTALGTNAGTVEFESYQPKHVRLKANVTTRSVLLLNDKHDPYWEVFVDGEPAQLMRANFLMRGVLLEPGEHTIDFHFRPPSGGLYVSLLMILVGGGLCGWLGMNQRRKELLDSEKPKPNSR